MHSKPMKTCFKSVSAKSLILGTHKKVNLTDKQAILLLFLNVNDCVIKFRLKRSRLKTCFEYTSGKPIFFFFFLS